MLYSFLTITLRANQNVTGLTLTIFGGGVANFFGGSLNTMAGGVGQISVAATSSVYRANLNNVTNLGVVGKLFLSRGASEISTSFGLNHSFGDILTGIILFFIIGSEFFISYKLSIRKSGKKEA